MYNTNWEEKYNRKALHEMTAEEAFDPMEWEHNLIEDFMISRDKRRKYRKPFDMTLERAGEIAKHWEKCEIERRLEQ